MSVIEKVEQIEQDFKQGNAPFDDVTFPEERLLQELPNSSMEGRAILVSMFATFDYNRDANQLVDNIIDLYHSAGRHLFDPNRAGASEEDEVAEHLKEIGFRYPSRDAHAWVTNCEILSNKYSGKWTELLLSVGADAASLVERLEDDDFLVLKGAKVAPMYARIVNDDVAPLSNVWDLEIPVDTHIRRLSKDLFSRPMQAVPDDEITDDDIRSEWRRIANKVDIDRSVVDGGLWHIGNKWNNWGEEYWESL